MEKLYTINDLKKNLKISDSTVRRYIRDGKIKTQMLGRQYRITETEFKAFLEREDKKGGKK